MLYQADTAKRQAGGMIARVTGLCLLMLSLAIAGCVSDKVNDLVDDYTTLEIENEPVDGENAELLEDLNFAFTDGDAFHAGLDGDATTLVFDSITGDSGTFTLTSGGNTASGDAAFGSCNLTVTASDFTSADDGPQIGDPIALPICNFSVVIGIDEIGSLAPLHLTVENAGGDSTTSDNVDVEVEKLCSYTPDAIPEAIENEICP